jgi:hypothetical protein
MRDWFHREVESGGKAVPAHFELGFGLSREAAPGEPHLQEPLSIDIGDGRTLRVSGKIDRIDRRPDGTLVLRDYKTGRAPRDDGGLFRGGRQLQIPFYILAAARIFPETPVVEAFLDYVDGGRQVGLDPALVHSDSFRALLRGLVDAIGKGVFVQEPTACDWCDFKVVCGPTPLLKRRRQLKLGDPRIQQVLRPAGRDVTFIPVDQDARERARRDHGTSFVLEAGAGTGKTTLLVDRIEQIVRSGAARLDEIAAVTFTENAATTMKLRLRERLERARSDADRPAEERRRADAALEVLERAQVSTIHALCAAILVERPLECGVPPGFRVADDAEMDILFAEAWEEWLTARLVAGDATLMAAVDSGIPLEADGWGERSSLRGLARTLVDQRDLRPLVAENPVDPAAWRRDLQAQAARARDLLTHVRDGDALGARLGAMVEFAAAADRMEGDALASYLRTLAIVPRNFGHKAHWTTPEALEEARAIAAWTSQTLAAWESGQQRRPARAPGQCRARGRGRLRGAQEGTRGPRLPRPAGQGARRPPGQRGGAPLLPGSLPRRHHRRVPGHRPAAGRGGGAPHRRAPGRAGRGRRRQAVDLPLPARGGRALPAHRRGSGGAARARRPPSHPELPLARRHPALREPRVRRADHPLRRGGPARIRSDRAAARAQRGSLRHRAAIRGPLRGGRGPAARGSACARGLPGRGGGGRAPGARSAHGRGPAQAAPATS